MTASLEAGAVVLRLHFVLALLFCACAEVTSPSAATLLSAGAHSRHLHTDITQPPQRPPRRGLLTDEHAGNSPFLFVHVPFFTCAVETLAIRPDGMQPACCTRTPADCAFWCETQYWNITLALGVNRGSTPVCSAFKWAREDPAPPLPSYSQCVLLYTIDQSSCSLELANINSPNPQSLSGIWQNPPSGTVIWDYYFRMYQSSTASPLVLLGAMNITGLSIQAAQLSPADGIVTATGDGSNLISAIQTAIYSRCCATSVRIVNISDVSNTTVNLNIAISQSWITDASPFDASFADLVFSDAAGVATLLDAIKRYFPSATAVTYKSLTHTGLGMPAVAADARIDATAAVCQSPPSRGSVIGLAVVLAVTSMALALQTAFKLAGCCHMGKTPEEDLQMVVHGGATTGIKTLGVFVSYRRSDLDLADIVVDQLHLAGLRVFYDRGGEMAGRPFEEELHRAVRECRVSSVIVTVDLLRSLVAHQPALVDWLLVELLLSVHYLRTLPGRHIFPLLVGPPTERHAVFPQRSHLLTDANFVASRDALPDVVPSATLALVSRMLQRDQGGSAFDAALQGITVKQLLLGQPATTVVEGALPFTGLLSIASVSIHGPDDYMPLVLRHRYADRIITVLQHHT